METTSFTAKYVRKPLYVDAVQVTEANFIDIARWCFGEISNIDDTPRDPTAAIEPTKQYIYVRVHNPKNPRQTKAFVGDWILYTERGYKVYTTKAFQANFDLVPKANVDPVPAVDSVDDADDDGRIHVEPVFGSTLGSMEGTS